MNSVVIYFTEKPTEEQIQAIKERSLTFPEKLHKVRDWVNLNEILGWRLIRYRVIEEVSEC
jgi:hypothetical protein